MKRTLPLLLIASAFLFAACKGKSHDDDAHPGQPGDKPGEPGTPGGPGGEPTAEELNTNPAEGVEPPTEILNVGAFTDGPVWHPGMGVLFFSTPLGEGALYRMLPDGRQLKLHDGSREAGTTPVGNTVTAAGELVTVEAKRIVRGPADGEQTLLASGYGDKATTPPPAAADGGVAPTGDGTFDTLNDVVARKDGTLYVTDPGYFAPPETVVANRIYRVTPDGKVEVAEAFEDVPKPNGIALSPDEKTLYVGFSEPVAGTLPFIRKYIVNDDGALGEWTKFIDVGPEKSSPDGLAIDRVGNVYVATTAGVEIYRSDGKAWGTIPVPEKPTGLAFGGEDLKTLYITTEGAKIWQLKAKVTGKLK